MRLSILAVSTAIVLLASCAKKPDGPSASADAALATSPPTKAPDGSKAKPAPVVVSMLAYAYAYEMEAPASRIAGLVAEHQAACAAAGPALCQVTAATLTNDGKDDAHASLQIRAAPAWLTPFRSRLGHDAQKAGGRIVRDHTTTEDLARQITDTQAAIRAKSALRDRLQTMLQTRPGKLEDLLEVEKTLAETQGDLDATQSELAMMQQRVQTSDLTIDYQAKGAFAANGVWRPVADAFGHSTKIFAGTLAMLVTLVVALAPWAAIGGALWWAAHWVRRSRSKRSSALRPIAATAPAIGEPPARP